METPNPSADAGGGGAGAARPANSSGPEGFRPADQAIDWTSTVGGDAGAASPARSSGPGGFAAPVAWTDFSKTIEAPLAVEQSSSVSWTGTGGSAAGSARPASSSGPGGFAPGGLLADSSKTTAAPVSRWQFSDTTAAPAALEGSTLRLTSGLEFMNPPGGETPAVEVSSTSVTMARKRTPGKWRRIPRAKRATATENLISGPKMSPELRAAMEKGDLLTLKRAEFIENMREEDCDLLTEEDRLDFYAFKAKMVPALRLIANAKPENTFYAPKTFSDTKEEHLTAEGMEAHMFAQFPDRQPCQQAKDFAELALAHYNEKKRTLKFELATTLLSNCFSEACGTTYGHVNFTAIPQKQTVAQPASKTKRLFFAELMLIPELQAYGNAQPMRVLCVCTIDDDSCYGGCHEIFRKIDHKMRGDMDYERCHACSDRMKHPKGQLFNGGHNSSRMPYYSAL